MSKWCTFYNDTCEYIKRIAQNDDCPNGFNCDTCNYVTKESLGVKKQLKISLKNFHIQIKSLREKRKLSQRDVSELSKLSQQTISLIERGMVTPTLRTMFLLGAALNVVFVVGKDE